MPDTKVKEHAVKIIEILKKEYPNPKPALKFSSPFELLVATILSAQCTDERVNQVTDILFKKYKKPEDYLAVTNEELENDIYSTGFYKNKAKSLKNCCRELADKHDGKVPADFDKINKLPGVGRKTASVVAGNGFGIPAIAVDTHVKRLSNLLGMVDSKNPEKIEAALKELLPEKYWIQTAHWLAAHGRKVCIARRPKCLSCVLNHLCPSYDPNAKE